MEKRDFCFGEKHGSSKNIRQSAERKIGHVAGSRVKLVCAAALNVESVPTTPGGIETLCLSVVLIGRD